VIVVSWNNDDATWSGEGTTQSSLDLQKHSTNDKYVAQSYYKS